MVNIACVVSATFFIAANVLIATYTAKEFNRPHFDFQEYKTLDPTYLETEWDYRLDYKGLFFAMGFVNAIAWLIFAVPLIQLAWVLSRNGTQAIGINVSIAMLAVAGTMTEWLASLFWLSMAARAGRLAKDYNLDDWLRDDFGGDGDDGMGWRALEVSYRIASGFIWLVDSLEWLFLSLIFVLIFFSVSRWRRWDNSDSFGRRWNGLSLFIGLLCLLDFVFEILQYEKIRVAGPISMLYSVINRILLIPAWILALGIMLPRAESKLQEPSDGFPTGETEMVSATPAPGADAFKASGPPPEL
eukprot:Nitzschia sp. Nitz4//scaffold45_size130396//102127//103128//NITZ4_003467-RA/size130396-snap-gene-0.143-mRNA-1//-1//CDS//3329552452//8237//frame0